MTLNIERRNRSEALASERGETWQKPTAKLATIINIPAIPNKTCWRLRMHSSFTFLSTTSTPFPMNSYLMRRTLSLNSQMLMAYSSRNNTPLKWNLLIIKTGVPEWSLPSDLILDSYGQKKNEEVKYGNLNQQLFSRVTNFQWISFWVPVLSIRQETVVGPLLFRCVYITVTPLSTSSLYTTLLCCFYYIFLVNKAFAGKFGKKDKSACKSACIHRSISVWDPKTAYLYGHYIIFVCLPKDIQLPNEQLAIICNFSLYLADKANMPDETGSKLKVHVDVIC